MRIPKFIGGGHSRRQTPNLLSVVRAVVTGDERTVTELAEARERERQRKLEVARKAEEAKAEKARQDSVATWIANECRKNGYWWPADWR